MDSIKDLLQQKADDIDLESKRTDLQLAQAELDRHFEGGKVVAEKITTDKVLLVKLQSSVVASELRFAQTQIIEAINKSSKQRIKSIRSRVK